MRAPLIAIPVVANSVGRYERYGLNTPYVSAIRAAGGVPVLVPVAAAPDECEVLLSRLSTFDGLLLTGGGDVFAEFYGQVTSNLVEGALRERDLTELMLTRAALSQGLPVFGICRGVQVLCVAAGGTLHQDIRADLPNAMDHRYHDGNPRSFLAHTVRLQAGSRLTTIIGSATEGDLPVNSMHHQAVDAPPPGFAVSAWAPDGVIEAIELDGNARQYALGVQWHPEELVPTHLRMMSLFASFVQACQEWNT